MTFILGSRCKDGVVLVADRKITIGDGEDYDECDKLFGEIRHVVYGSPGVQGMFELFRGQVMDYGSTHPNEKNFQNAKVKLSQLAFDTYKKYEFNNNLYFEVLVAIQPPNELSRLNVEKMDYLLQENRPEQFQSVKNKAMERLHKHKKEIHDLFT